VRIVYAHRTSARDGSAVHIRALQAAFRRRGHVVEEVGPPRTSFGFAGSWRAGPLRRRLREAAAYAYTPLAYRRVRRTLRRFRADLLYERHALANASGVLAAARAGIPSLLEWNAPESVELAEEGALLFPRIAARAEAAVLRRATLVAVVSGPLEREAWARGVRRDRTILTPNGVDLERYRPEAKGEEVRRRWGLEGTFVAGFVGYVREWHRLDRVLEAIARGKLADRGLRLLVVGDGPARADLEARSRTLGLDGAVRFVGEVPHEAVPDHLAAFDVALLPAIRPYASPLKLVEYLAAGRAVVAVKQENVEEIARDGREALLVPAGDADALAAALDDLVTRPERRAALGAAGRARVVEGDFTWDGNVSRIERALAALRRP
jgi:glycosyltransferase involved in cell wall biosynthesis